MDYIQPPVTGFVNAGASAAPGITGVTAGNALVLIITGGTDSLPTDSSLQTWVKASSQVDSTNEGGHVYYLLNANAGTHTVTYAPGGSIYFNYALIEFPPLLGVNTVAALVSSGTGGNPSSLTASISTVSGPTLAIALMGINATTDNNANYGIQNPPAGWTTGILVQQDATAANVAQNSSTMLGGAQTKTAAWTFGTDASSQGVAGYIVAFNMAPVASGLQIPFPMRGRGERTGKGGIITRALFPRLPAIPASSGTSVGATGVSGTGSVGTASVAIDTALTSTTGTGSVGTVIPSATAPLTGVSGTGSVGTLTPSTTAALTAVTGAGSLGTTVANVTIGLTGVTATGSVGTVTASQPLTGVIGTASLGTTVPNIDKPLSGLSGTGSLGTVGPAVDRALSGNSATGSVGAVAPVSIAALTGVSGAASLGALGANVTVALSGVSGAGSVGTVTAVVGGTSVALSGVSATGSVNAPGVDIQVGLTGVSGTGSVGTVAPPSTNVGGNAWEKGQKKRRAQVQAEINARNLEIIKAELAQEAVVEIEPYDDDEEALMLLL